MHNKRKYNRFIFNTFMQYIMIVAKYVFPMITLPYLTRVLSADLYGVVTYMTATMSFFQLIVDFGFDLSATKEIAKYQTNKKYIGEILGSVLQAKFFLVVISFCFFTILIPFIEMLRENILLGYLYFGSILLSILLPDFLFRGLERMEIITSRFILSRSITTLLTFIIIQSEKDINLVPILNMMGSLIAIIWTWKYIKFQLDISIILGNKINVFRQLKQSAVYFVSTFATTAFTAMNTFMFGVMSIAPSQIAYWGISYSLIGSAQQLYSPIINSLYPYMMARKDFVLVKRIVMILMLPIMLIVLVIYIFSDFIIAVFGGSEYSNANQIFRALLPVLIFSFPAQLIGFPVLGAMEKVKEVTYTTVFSSLFHVLGLFILVFFGQFTVFNTAVLRSVTEVVLLGTRLCVLYITKRNERAFNEGN